MALLVGLLAAVAPGKAQAATYPVTSTQCEGPGSFTEAVGFANANPGHDTITLSPGLVIDWLGCRPTPVLANYMVQITESVTIQGNGGRLQGNLTWVNSIGAVNPLARCPFYSGAPIVHKSPAFARIGVSGADNSGVVVDVNDLDMDQLTSVAQVYEKATLNVDNSDFTEIRDIHEKCQRSAFGVSDGANLSISNGTIEKSRTWTHPDNGWKGVISGVDGGQLNVDNVDFSSNWSGGAIRWGGQGANVVSSQFFETEGILLTKGPMTIVNSAFEISQGFSDPMRLYSATGSGGMTFRASTVSIPTAGCSSRCTKGLGVPFLAQDSAIHFEQTAVGVGDPTLGTGKLLGVDGTGSYTADTQTWIQPVQNQDAAALQAITSQPALLTDAPGLPNQPTTDYHYPTSVTPLNPGELIDVIDNAASGQANQLLNPINGAFITQDVLGNPRVDGNDKRDIGAVQLTLAPHLAVVSEASMKVGLHWTRPPDPDTGALTGYAVLYREAGSSGPWTRKDVAGASTVATEVTGLTNGTKYEFTVSAVNTSGDGPASNQVTGTPRGTIGAPHLKVDSESSMTVGLEWTRPPDPDTGAVTGYEVWYREAGSSGPWTRKDVAGADTLATEVTGLTNGTEYEFTVSAVNASGDGPASNQVTGTPLGTAGKPIVKPVTELTVKARAKARKLRPNKKTQIVRLASTNAQIKIVKVQCLLNGNKLTGKDKRSTCKIKKKTTSNAKVWVKSKCSVGLKVRVKIVANETGMDKATWQRTWKVKNNPRTYCPISGNG